MLRELVELATIAAQGGDLNELLALVAARLRSTIGAVDCDIYALDGGPCVSRKRGGARH